MRQLYADVIIDITHERLDRVFQYRVPPEMDASAVPGACVVVPFGKGGRTVRGYVIARKEKAEIEPERIKEIREIRPQDNSVESKLIRLAVWMRRTCGSTMIQALKTVLPVKEKKNRKVCRLIEPAADAAGLRAALEEAQNKHFSARARLLEYLLEHREDGRIPEKNALMRHLGISGEVIKALEKRNLIRVREETIYREPVELRFLEESFTAEKPLSGGNAMHSAEEDESAGVRAQNSSTDIDLTAQQRALTDGILRSFEKDPGKPCLIEGVTGSGKTQIYMELAGRTLGQGRQVIILIPEIALSPQTVRRFALRFGRRIAVLHSRMGVSERSDQFEKIRNGDADLVVGPRSALFAPFRDVGLIIVDEEHENSYLNEETPHYDAREAAIARAAIEGAHVVFGSATPSVTSRFRCDTGRYRLFRLTERFGGAALPQVLIADMREELRAGNRSVLSGVLREELERTLGRKEQAMLFLNRRGYAGFFSCRSCGYVVKCPHCDISLTAHRGGKMICHYCGHTENVPQKCPSCGSVHIHAMRAGTQQIEQVLQKEYPQAVILRMDADTTRGKEGHTRILEAFAGHKADILVGTQMIVKGHDFPGVTLVGALLADLSLFAANHRAAEQTYQLLVQAIGRAGRADLPGKAVIQTYQPDHYSIVCAASQDYQAFYEQEIAVRTIAAYPPCAPLLAVRGSAADEERLAEAMQFLRGFLTGRIDPASVQLIGPAPDAVAKIQDYYRYVLYIRAKNEETLIRLRSSLEAYIEINSGFREIRIQYEMEL